MWAFFHTGIFLCGPFFMWAFVTVGFYFCGLFSWNLTYRYWIKLWIRLLNCHLTLHVKWTWEWLWWREWIHTREEITGLMYGLVLIRMGMNWPISLNLSWKSPVILCKLRFFPHPYPQPPIWFSEVHGAHGGKWGGTRGIAEVAFICFKFIHMPCT